MVGNVLRSLWAEPPPAPAPVRVSWDCALVAVVVSWSVVETLLRQDLAWRPLCWATVHRIVRRAEVPAIRLHDSRRTYATLAPQAGVNMKVVSQRLGHATVQPTSDTYAHGLPDEDDQAADLFQAHVYGVAT